MATDDHLARLKAGLDEAEEAANFALELEQPYRDKAFEVEYQWVRLTRKQGSEGPRSSMFLDGAPSPREVLAQVAAVRKVLAEYQVAQERYEAIQETGEPGARDYLIGLEFALRALASIYTDPAEES